MKSVPTISFLQFMISFVEYHLLLIKKILMFLAEKSRKKTLHNNLMRVLYVCPFFRLNICGTNEMAIIQLELSVRCIDLKLQQSAIFVKKRQKQNQIAEEKNSRKKYNKAVHSDCVSMLRLLPLINRRLSAIRMKKAYGDLERRVIRCI